MAPDREMEGYARECVRLAELAAEPAIRDRLLQLARAWTAVAVKAEKMPNPNSCAELNDAA